MRSIFVFVALVIVVLALGACSIPQMFASEVCVAPALDSEIILTEGVYAGTRGTVASVQYLESNPSDKVFTLVQVDGSVVIVPACIDWMPAGEAVTDEPEG